jgi:hypothetical protein
MKKMDTQFHTSKTKDRLSQGTQQSPKNTPKEEILQETEDFMEMVLDKVNQNVQEALKKFQDNKNK